MANRRLISLSIVNTDSFLELPLSSRLLYYDLILRADDDGFVGNPKRIAKDIGAKPADFDNLNLQGYLIVFESGVCVIRHWFIHNLMRHDRYHETQYKGEKALLIKIDNIYEIINTNNDVIPNGNHLAPEVKLSEVKLSEVKKYLLSGLQKDANADGAHEKFVNPKDLKMGTDEYLQFTLNPIDPRDRVSLHHAAKEVLDHLNVMCGKRFRETDTNLDFIKARLKSGVSISICRKIINLKCAKWLGKSEFEEYLRPSTLFNKTKFEQYYGELKLSDKKEEN